MGKAKTPAAKVMSDTQLEILDGSWPHDLALRCDHAGVEIREGHEPDIADEPTADGQHLVRARYTKRCDRFGRVEKVTLNALDDPARECGHCHFLRSIVGLA